MSHVQRFDNFNLHPIYISNLIGFQYPLDVEAIKKRKHSFDKVLFFFNIVFRFCIYNVILQDELVRTHASRMDKYARMDNYYYIG